VVWRLSEWSLCSDKAVGELTGTWGGAAWCPRPMRMGASESLHQASPSTVADYLYLQIRWQMR
jgi:hypothetical protein